MQLRVSELRPCPYVRLQGLLEHPDMKLAMELMWTCYQGYRSMVRMKFAYKALSNKETLHIFLIYYCFICKVFVLFTALYIYICKVSVLFTALYVKCPYYVLLLCKVHGLTRIRTRSCQAVVSCHFTCASAHLIELTCVL